MKNQRILGLFVAVAAGSAACAANPPPAAKAAEVEHMQCDRASASRDALVRSLQVLSVQPVYAHVMTGSNAEERVAGARLVVRPPRGVSAEDMTRVLQCHGARVLLGQIASSLPNDPYSLPQQWVNIDVRPYDGNFAVVLSADSVTDNLAVYGRAKNYADEHMVATEPDL
jgi:hypothetical protein